MLEKRKATYKIIRFPLDIGDRYVGVAWNYAEAVLIATGDFSTYTEARAHLHLMCEEYNVELRWFDGSYVSRFGNLEPCELTHSW